MAIGVVSERGEDVHQIIQHIQKTVFDQFGIELEREVRAFSGDTDEEVPAETFNRLSEASYGQGLEN